MGIFGPKYKDNELVEYLSSKGDRVKMIIVTSEFKRCKGDIFKHMYYLCQYEDSHGFNCILPDVRERKLSKLETT